MSRKPRMATSRDIAAALEQRAFRLGLINEISKRIAAVLDLDVLLDKAASLIQEHFGYHHVALFTIDRQKGELVMRAVAGNYAHHFPPDHRLKLSQGMVGWVGENGQKLLARDVRLEPHYVNLYPEAIPTLSELSVPLKVGNDILGVLDLQSPRINAFDENDILVIETLADQISIAIENARLYEAVQRELAERKRMEQYIIRAERLAAMGSITATLAHEVKNPLQAIRSHLDLVMDFPLNADERDASIKVCSQEVDHLTEIIERTLGFARTGENKPPAATAVSALIERALELANKSLERARILTSVHIPFDLPLVNVVAEQIVQVLLNLFINSAEAMVEGGTIEICACAEEANIVLTFTNDGPPIPMEYLDHVFDPFFTTKPSNTGLGLYVSHLILQQHGGRIQAENLTTPQGVRFTIYLPIASQVSAL